ncbi:MAG TPA: NADH-quinone oxidoreductase subunit N [Candidatus Dormibacteraeota bacterium]|jgi:NADH-quinone oxidoreductase subunit N
MTTFGNLLAFSPELWLLSGAIIVFVLARLRPGVSSTAVGFATLAVAFLALLTQFGPTITILDGAFVLDRFALFLDVLLLATAAITLLVTLADVIPGESRSGELAAFLLLATLGAMLAVSAAEMVALFLALELLAVNLYLLAALARRGGDAAHAGLGYLVLGMAGSALLLYGLALIYGLTGETRLTAAGRALRVIGPDQPAVLLALTLIIAGFAGKLGLVPVRWWTRAFDRGVPLRVLTFISSAGIVAGFAAFTRLVSATFSGSTIAYASVIAVVAAVAMTGGNLLALTQTSVRRLLAYSSIAQGGYALAALVDLRHTGVSAVLIFLTALALTNLCAFAAVIAYARAVHSDVLSDLAGMARSTPALALGMALALASLIGLPPLAGFFGKFFVLQAAVDGGFAWLAVIGVVNVLLSALTYLRILRIAFFDSPVYEVAAPPLDGAIRVALGVSAAAVTFFGLFLGPLSSAASSGARALLH